MSYDKSFIEVQFPVSKISKESYKERKAGSNQTLTGLGKWWGRKPLILVRAAIVAALLPATDNPKKDREIFLKILSMDDRGLELRKNKPISTKDLLANATAKEKQFYFVNDNGDYIAKYNKGIKKEDKDKLQFSVFNRFSYDEKLQYCLRSEEVNNDAAYDWKIINEHLGTRASSLQELVKELGLKRFGKEPRVGDCFAGGGSIPFEAGRVGCDVYASDLNPLAGLLTWADLNILSKSNSEVEELKEFQEKVYDEVAKQVEEWGIENNEQGWKAKYYLYCNETICPECRCKVPLAPNWVISDSFKAVAKLKYNEVNHNFDIIIENNVSKEEMKNAKDSATIVKGNLVCPYCNSTTPITSLRRDKKNEDGNIIYGLRKWEQNEFIAREDDVFQERLYAIKYIDKFETKSWEEVMKKPAPATDACYGKVYYTTPTKEDLQREEKVKELLKARFNDWQEKGFIPNSRIELGDETTRLIRERGWVYWHHLFNARQLLVSGLLMEKAFNSANNKEERVLSLLSINKCVDWNSKLSIWNTARDVVQATYTNQALNTLYNHATRTLSSLYPTWMFNIMNYPNKQKSNVKLTDARVLTDCCDIWITDPPYADAINYHELSEFFLAWDREFLNETFNDWYSDSKRVLAVKGVGETFNTSMVEIYSNLKKNMTSNGMQIVMFTHSDVKVWAELAMILWSSGLQVTAAWNIATETESGGLKDGNYVKGTVILILRKQTSDEVAYLDELYAEIEEEVKYQIDSMRELDDKEDPNFSDPDYLLAAYAASLKILTSFKNIEDIDVKYELSKARNISEVSPIENIINQAVKIAYDYLIPSEFDSFIWKSLIPEERLYLKGIELEKQNLYQLSAYQELARGFGVGEYTTMLASTKANHARLKTPKEFSMKNLNDSSTFGNSLLRNILVAIHLGMKEEDTSKGRNWLKTEITDYWNKRSSIIEILEYLSKAEYIDNMEHWKECAHEAFILKNLIENDNI
jgi:putative DNA methylase